MQNLIEEDRLLTMLNRDNTNSPERTRLVLASEIQRVVKDYLELKDDIKEQKALQQKGIEVLEGDGKIEDKLQQMERHFEPKRNEMEFLENINKFDTRVMTKEIIRAEEEKKNKAYNQAVIRRMQDFGR